MPICFISQLMTMCEDTNYSFTLCQIAAVSTKVPFFNFSLILLPAMLLCRSWAIFFSKDVKVSAIVFSSFTKDNWANAPYSPSRLGCRDDWKWVYTLLILVCNRVWFLRKLRECMNVFIVSIDLFTDTAAILNQFDLMSTIGCPGGMSTICFFA